MEQSLDLYYSTVGLPLSPKELDRKQNDSSKILQHFVRLQLSCAKLGIIFGGE
jgi:hypothetical protein